MKKTILSLLIALTTISTYAQTEEGNLLLGTSIANIQVGLDNDYVSVGISPNAGYFIFDNFALGGSLPLQLSANGNSSSTSIGLGAFGRYYIPMDKISPFFGGGLGYRIYSNSYTYTDWNGQKVTTSNSDGIPYANAAAGIAYFLNENIGVHGTMNIGDLLNPGTTLSLGLGLSIYFNPGNTKE